MDIVGVIIDILTLGGVAYLVTARALQKPPQPPQPLIGPQIPLAPVAAPRSVRKALPSLVEHLPMAEHDAINCGRKR